MSDVAAAQHSRRPALLDATEAAVSLKPMKTTAALASLFLSTVATAAHAQDAALAGKTIASIDRPEPSEDSARPPIVPPARAASTANADAPDPHHEGALGRHRLGALAGAGFPSIVSGQVVYKYADWVGFTGTYGATPTLTIPVAGGVNVAQQGFSGTARAYPFRGAFFFGVGGGRSAISAEQTASQSGGAHTSLHTTTVFVTGELGFLYRFQSGFSIGADVGVQVPTSSIGGTTASVAGQPVASPQQLRDVMKYFASEPVPVVNVLRLGYVL